MRIPTAQMVISTLSSILLLAFCMMLLLSPAQVARNSAAWERLHRSLSRLDFDKGFSDQSVCETFYSDRGRKTFCFTPRPAEFIDAGAYIFLPIDGESMPAEINLDQMTLDLSLNQSGWSEQVLPIRYQTGYIEYMTINEVHEAL